MIILLLLLGRQYVTSLPCTINHSFSLSYAFKLHVHAHYVYVAYKQMKNVFLYKYMWYVWIFEFLNQIYLFVVDFHMKQF